MRLGTGLALPLARGPFGGPALSLPFSAMSSGSDLLAKGVTFARAGLATQYDATGTLTWAPNNLLTTSATLGSKRSGTGTSALSSDFTAPMSGGQVKKVVPAVGTSNDVQTYIGGNAGAITTPGKFIQSFYFHRQTGAYSTSDANLAVRVGGSSYSVDIPFTAIVPGANSATVLDVGGGWYRLWLAYDFTGTAEQFLTIIYVGGATANGTDAFYFADAQTEAVTYQTTPRTYVATTSAAYYAPRFDYDPATAITNLVTYSQDFAQAIWGVSAATKVSTTATDPNGGSTAVTILPTAQYGSLYYNSNILLAGKTYAISFYARRSTGVNALSVYTGSGALIGTFTPTPVWTRYSFFHAPTSDTSFFVQDRNASGFTAFDVAFAQVELGSTYAHPYIPTTSVTASAFATSRGLLIEEARTNLITYSGDLANAAWAKEGSTAVSGATAPDGTNKATTLTAVSGNQWAYQAISVAASTYAYSIWVRRRTGTGGVFVWNGSNAQVSITPTSSWQRFTFTVSASVTFYALIGLATAGDQIDVWGAQLELGSFATSYIPTTSASVTRAAETASMTGTAFSSWYNQSEGTFVVEFDTPNTASTALIFTLTGGGGTSNTFFGNTSVSIFPPTGNSATFTPTYAVANAMVKRGLGYKLNDCALSDNGGTVATDTTFDPNGTTLQLQFGNNGAGASYLNGHIKSLTYYKTRKTNADLQLLTAPSDSAPANAIDVALFMGQSNSGGGQSDLSNPYSPDANVLTFDGTSLVTYQADSGSGWAADLQYAHNYRAAYPTKKLAILRSSVSGTNLAVQWNPASGAVYNSAVTYFTAAIAALIAAGYAPTIRIVDWMQGESDAVDTAMASAYQSNLAAFIAVLRDPAGVWKAPAAAKIAIGRISNSTAWTYRAAVRTAEANVAAADVGGPQWIYDTDDLPLEADNMHYTHNGQLTRGERLWAVDQGTYVFPG